MVKGTLNVSVNNPDTYGPEKILPQLYFFKTPYFLINRLGAHIFSCLKNIFYFLVIGNIGRYANHSCDPNIVIVPVRIQTVIPHLALVASRDINKV